MSDDAEARAHELVGQVLNDKWTLESVLGVGGMAAVYSARHRNGARAAVKVLDITLARVEEVRVRFLREGYAANKVEHPGAVKVLDDDVVTSGPAEGTAYIVMELLEGQSLESRAQSGEPVSEREFLEIADAVLDVLVAAHAAGVIHRDLKPENLFLLADPEAKPRVKVLDFGLARLQEQTSGTGHGLALGTPSFMSPEQAAGIAANIDGRTDLFALAATGFRLLADRRIHEGTNPVAIVLKMASEPAPKLRTVAPYVSEAVARIIDRGLAFQREDRYPTAEAMRADVQKALAELPTAAAFAPTMVARPAPASREPTIELSASEIEVADAASVARSPAPVPVPAPAPAPAFARAAISTPPPPLPIQKRRRPSFIPLGATLLFAAIAAKLAYDAQSSPPTPSPPSSASAIGATTTVSASASEPSSRDDAAPSSPLPASSVPSSLVPLEDSGAAADTASDAGDATASFAPEDASADDDDASSADDAGADDDASIDAAVDAARAVVPPKPRPVVPKKPKPTPPKRRPPTRH